MELPLFSDFTLLTVTVPDSLAEWQRTCRSLLRSNIAPEAIVFQRSTDTTDLLSGSTPLTIDDAPRIAVPRDYSDAVARAFYHRSPEAPAIMYRVLWRILREDRNLMQISTDDDVHQLLAMAKAVKRDEHKMHAFVRFRKQVLEDGSEHYVAWHRPDHRIARLAANFFVDRFNVMNWSILTPDESIHWNTQELSFSPGVDCNPLSSDPVEDVWRTYYASTFNPARLSVKAMKKELPVRHWQTLPEAQLIPDLIQTSGDRTNDMLQKQSVTARDFLPEIRTLETMRAAVQQCRGCQIYCNATQAIFGEGPPNALCAFIGEQPGDNEDLTGRPFVGPAGQLFDRAIAEVGLCREELYLTGAVKHFKHEIVGKKRIHRNPSRAEIAACRPWVLEELKIVQPQMIVCMGVSAATSILGRQVTLRDWRGRFFASALAPHTFVTAHPAGILRTVDPAEQEQAYLTFVSELRMIAERLHHLREVSERSPSDRNTNPNRT